MSSDADEGRRSWRRRSGFERRGADRRKEEEPVVVERRDGSERRTSARRTTPDRRSGFDRRAAYPRLTPAPYSSAEAQLIKDMVAHQVVRPACPRCNATLIVGPFFRRGRHRIQEVYCATCRHAVMINGTSDVPAGS